MEYEDAQEAHEIITEIYEIEALKKKILDVSTPDYAELSNEKGNVMIHNKGLVSYLRNQSILYLDNKISEAKEHLSKVRPYVGENTKTVLVAEKSV